jgi:carbon starvation protein
VNAAVLAIGSIVLLYLGFRFYGRFLDSKVFSIQNESGQTPAEEFNDNVDFVPTQKEVLFGHHYSSIAGAAPIVGPAVAVIWGWLPALLWVLIGVIFMGAVHDYGALIISMKHKGQSIGQLAQEILGPRTRTMFLTIIFFLVLMVLAVFALVITNLFIQFPASVIPVNFEIFIAIIIGIGINKNKIKLKIPSIIAQVLLMLMIYIGTQYPISLEPIVGKENVVMTWISFLMSYSFIACVLPVWLLLQPRDFINSHQLVVGLVLLVLGLIVSSPTVVAPAINPNPVGAPPWFPFLFITIACGAISGFHGLVSSGTTSKQVAKFKDAKFIGYGGMLGEGLLAILATLAVTAGFKSSAMWHSHYSSWNAANGLASKIKAFVLGSGNFLQSLGIPAEYSNTVIAVLIISFAATSLDTAARIQRLIISEIGSNLKIKLLENRYVSAFIAIATAFALIMMRGGGKGGLILWPLFGATNQMLACLTLIVISIYLLKTKPNNKYYLCFGIPAIFLAIITSIGIINNIQNFMFMRNYFLTTVGCILFICQIWIIIEAIIQFNKMRRT